MLHKVLSNIYRFFYKQKLKMTHQLQYGKHTSISKSCTFEGYNRVLSYCELNNTSMGYASFTGGHCYFLNTKIGRFCSIGDYVSVVVGQHPTSKYVCNHPAFYSLRKQVGFTYADKQTFEDIKYLDENSKTIVSIGDGVWIGNNAIILNGLTIGEGAIIAAGSVVTKNVAPYEIVGGVPAKKIKDRFTEDQKEFLLKYKLYEKDLSFYQENVKDMEDIETFIQKHKEEIK